MTKRILTAIAKIMLVYAACLLLHVGYCVVSGTQFEISWQYEGIILVVTLLLVLGEALWKRRKAIK